MPTAPLETTPSPEDSVRIALDELGREAIHSPRIDEDSALIPIRERHVRRCDQSEREIARNHFPVE